MPVHFSYVESLSPQTNYPFCELDVWLKDISFYSMPSLFLALFHLFRVIIAAVFVMTVVVVISLLLLFVVCGCSRLRCRERYLILRVRK